MVTIFPGSPQLSILVTCCAPSWTLLFHIQKQRLTYKAKEPCSSTVSIKSCNDLDAMIPNSSWTSSASTPPPSMDLLYGTSTLRNTWDCTDHGTLQWRLFGICPSLHIKGSSNLSVQYLTLRQLFAPDTLDFLKTCQNAANPSSPYSSKKYWLPDGE